MNTKLIEKLTANIDSSLNDANENKSNMDPDILGLRGMSGLKTRHFLNNVVQRVGGRYLEIGVWAGSTFCAALNGSKTNQYCVACDNWSEFGGPRNEFLMNVTKFVDLENLKVTFLEKDCFQLTEEDLRIKEFGKFPIYLYDGPHARIEHMHALTKYIDFVEDTFVYLCDDWNWYAVAEYGTQDAYKELNLTVHKEWVMKTPNNIDCDHPGWWNGYYAAIVSKPRKSDE